MNIVDRVGVVHSRGNTECTNYPPKRAGVVRASTHKFVTCLVCIASDLVSFRRT